MTWTDAEAAVVVGRVAEIWRYPVKSMRGERVTEAAVDERGLIGDRLFAVRDADGRFGSGKNTRRFRRMDGLLDFQARYLREPGPQFVAELTGPHGGRHLVGTAQADEAVRGHLGRQDVAVLAEDGVSHFDDGPIHLLSAASLDWMTQAVPEVPVDTRRFRPNLLVEAPGGPFVEDGWVGATIRFVVADAVHAESAHVDRGPVIEICAPTTRCVMVNAPQDDLPASALPLRALADRDLKLGVWARVLRAGLVRTGDLMLLGND